MARPKRQRELSTSTATPTAVGTPTGNVDARRPDRNANGKLDVDGHADDGRWHAYGDIDTLTPVGNANGGFHLDGHVNHGRRHAYRQVNTGRFNGNLEHPHQRQGCRDSVTPVASSTPTTIAGSATPSTSLTTTPKWAKTPVLTNTTIAEVETPVATPTLITTGARHAPPSPGHGLPNTGCGPSRLGAPIRRWVLCS